MKIFIEIDRWEQHTWLWRVFMRSIRHRVYGLNEHEERILWSFAPSLFVRHRHPFTFITYWEPTPMGLRILSAWHEQYGSKS